MVDWFRVIADIANHDRDMSCRAIAKEIGISKASIGRYYRGDNVPDFDTGEMLIDMWAEVTGFPKDMVPRKRL